LPIYIAKEQTVTEAEHLLAMRLESGDPVLDERGNLLGVLTRIDIERVPPAERDQRLVKDMMNRDVLVLYGEETLDDALEQLTGHRVSWAPVIDVEGSPGGRHVEGILTAADVTQAYREAAMKSSRPMRGLSAGTVMIEEKIAPGMQLAGRTLRDAHLPPDTLVVSIRREDELLFPRGSAMIRPDVVTFLVGLHGEEHLRVYLAEREGITQTGREPARR
jgi:CIC family chloride channel protein